MNNVNMHIATFIPTGELIGIDKAIKGRNCLCRCYSCQGELVAKKGESNQWHFAHYKNSKTECEYSFWVVCRDLATQIFSSELSPVNCINISHECRKVEVCRISLDDTKVDDITFDLSFYTKDIGRIFVYFLTPEYSRNHLENFDAFSENVLLINLSNAPHEKDNITAFLSHIIVDDINAKSFIGKKQKIPIQKTTVSLFETLEQEEKQKKLELEVLKNTPNLSLYNADIFIKTISEPKFEINTSKLSGKDKICIHSLDTIFISLVAKHGNKSNKSFAYKEIYDNGKVFFFSYDNSFFCYVILETKFVLLIPQNKTLEPVMATPFRDSIAKKINKFWNL